MESPNWQKVKAVFDSVYEIEPNERSGYLEIACADDEELRREIEELLAAAEAAGSFLNEPFANAIDGLLTDVPAISLEPGQVFNRYEVIRRIGEGGMGVVYLAKDTHLNRQVALKLLSEGSVLDPDHLLRFMQEARLASTLNHPNILTIYEIGQDGEIPFISTEFVAGETLRQQISRGALSLEQALDVAIEVASALEAAHDADIVHRDVKPENVMLRKDGYVKVLDFGLAKFGRSGNVDEGTDVFQAVKTRPGFIMGTVNYMSPEQARGNEVDARTDIWSLGVVLYEMLAGKPPFEGVTPSDVMAAILKEQPKPIKQILPNVPEKLGLVLEKALSKSPQDRHQTTAELLRDLREVRRGTRSQAGLKVLTTPDTTLRKTRVSGGDGRTAFRQTESVGEPVHPKLSHITFTEAVEQYPAWSATGAEIAFSREESGIRSIFIKNIASGEERRLTSGLYDDIQPAWSPDGKTILFVRSRQQRVRLEPADVFGLFCECDIWSIDLTTQKVARLVENAFNPDYSPDGSRIAFDASWAGPRRIWAVDRQGYNPQQLTSDVSEGISHVRPRWSPDGLKLVFQNIEGTKFDVRVFDLTSRRPTWITDDSVQDFNPVWSPSGRYIYFSSYRGGGINIWRIAVTPDGVPAGAPQQLTNGAGQDVEIAISRDGKRLAFSILKQNADIWRLPVSPETGWPVGMPQEIITTTREDSRGALSPDGKTIAFNSDRTGEMNIWLHSFEDGRTRQLTRGAGGDFQANWSPDGSTIAFFSSRSGTTDIWLVDVASGKLKQLTSSCSVDVSPSFSPDGKMIAFTSDKSGRPEVWVMRSDGSEARQLTEVGLSVMGHFLLWNRTGDAVTAHLFNGRNQSVTVAVGLDGTTEPLREVAGGAHMSFSPDRSRIMDVVGHKSLWVSPLYDDGVPEKVFEFSENDVRIDYPVWSPDGHWVLFDRLRPKGGDVWMMEQFEQDAIPDIALEGSKETEIDGEPRSIAILPFTNLTRDQSLGFYEFSLADAVITELARQRSLAVRPSSVIAKYVGQTADPLAVGRELKVEAILSTSFLSTQQRIRVNSQLIDVQNGNVIWGDTIDTDTEDVIRVQDTISHHIVNRLKLELKRPSKPEPVSPATTDPNAYKEYLLGKDQFRHYVFHTAAVENVDSAIGHFNRAIDLDPKFSQAYCALGKSRIQRVLKGDGDLDDLECAAASFDRALSLDSGIFEARAYRAMILRFQGDAETSREQLADLRRDAPNSFEAQYMSAAAFRLDGDSENASRCYSEMLRLDPTAKVSVHCFRARFFWYQGKYDEAFKELEQAKRQGPNHPFVGFFHSIVTFLSGDPAGAEALLRSLLETYPLDGFRPHLSMCLSALGRHESALNELTDRTQKVAAANPDVSYGLASAYLMAGKTDLALDWLTYSIDHGYKNRPWLQNNPIWKRMQNDPRFIELMSGLAVAS